MGLVSPARAGVSGKPQRHEEGQACEHGTGIKCIHDGAAIGAD